MWAQPGTRTGLRIRGERGHPVVRRSVIRFAAWLRNHHEFPVRLPVYLSPHERIVAMTGGLICSAFFAPWAPDVEPYIRMATGDYPILRVELGRDDALASILHTLAHDVVIYQRWIQTGEIPDRGARVRARGMLHRYAETVAHP